jgi:lysophospholipase L1-like esterase
MLWRMPRCLPVLLFILAASFLTAARGELVLTNFTSAHPLKVMAVGDSITDDCEVNGAWRAYLQPLLETNGYAFTFIGRESSTASGSFTKTNHEGMCGAVIAPPGVFAVHGYATTNAYLEKTVADALTNATPDLVLILIGANDIGRGRDPWLTATNDMPHLLDLIFSNAPNANILLAKITTLQNATANYGNYALNVPVYNAALQRVVNQRRAAGQNVFLADMFSVVDYFTMFNGDHLHPNAVGLQVIAGEWLTRIQSVTIRSNPVVSVLIKGGDNWKYSDTGVDLGTNWMRADFDDSGWSNGPARLGYGDKEALTTVSYGPVSTNKYPTTYFRHSFAVPANLTLTNLVLRLAQEHGSVVWLNGQEIWRTNLPAGPIAFTNLALVKYPGTDAPYIFTPVSADASKLVPGTNVIAVELHQLSASYPVIGFDMELIGTGNQAALPVLSLTMAGTNLVFAWPADNGGGFGLSASTNLATANWTPAGVPAQTNGAQLVVTQALDSNVKFFRLQNN